jgi:hypothetical protein
MERDEQVVPEGTEFLKMVADLENRCELETLERLPQMGKKAPECIRALGTVLSLLDRLSSCWWGCQQGTHTIERLVFRSVSLGRASVRLSGFGFYDEALALNRSMCEIANLLCLFKLDADAVKDWAEATPQRRKEAFGPVKVRLRIEGLGHNVPIDEHRYRALSDVALHVTAPISPQAHNILEWPVSAGHFQEEGLLVALNELALALVYVAVFSSTLIPLQKEIRNSILRAAEDLGKQIGGANILEISEYRAKAKEQLRKAMEESDREQELHTSELSNQPCSTDIQSD